MSAPNQIDLDTLMAEAERQFQSPSGDPPVAEKPIVVKVGNMAMQFANQDELSAYMTDMTSKLAKFNQPVAQPPAQQPVPDAKLPGQKVTGDEDERPGPDGIKPKVKKYAEKFMEDPDAATDEVITRLTGGVSLKQIVSGLQMVAQHMQVQSAQSAAAQFRAEHPEYEFNDENAAKMKQIMETRNYQWTTQGLEDAYNWGIMHGVFQRPESDGPSYSQVLQQPNRRQAPPPVGRSAQAPDAVPGYIERAESMDLDQLRNVIGSIEQQLRGPAR